MRHSTPVGSTITKSRMPQGLSAGGSAFKPYLAINPCAWTWRHQASTSCTSRCIMKLSAWVLL